MLQTAVPPSLQNSKHFEELFFLWFGHFPRKMGEDDQNPNTLRDFSSYKIRFLKSSSKRSKNTGGRVGLGNADIG